MRMTLTFCTAAMTGLLLAGCGGGVSGAVAACEATVAERLPDRTYQLDVSALRESAREEGDVIFLSGPLVIDPGMTNEQRQTVECRVRGDDVIAVNFIW